MKWILLTLLLSNQLHATTLNDCEVAGQNYGNQEGMPVDIPEVCKSLIESQISSFSFSKSKSKLTQVFGFKNILYIKKFTSDDLGNLSLLKEYLTSGKKSRLTNIIATNVDEQDHRVYVINKKDSEYEILSFSSLFGGNNTPLRKIISNEILGATNIASDAANNEIFVISKNNGWVKVFNKLADINGRRAENSLNVKRSLTGLNSQIVNPIDLSINNDELFILEAEKLLVFDKNASGNTAPKRSISGPSTQITNALSFKIKDSKIYIKNQDQSIKVFNLEDSGNVSPQ